MSSRIDEAFAAVAERQETALVTYLTAGYPTPAETVGLIRAAAEGGADVIELGVPFSDPMGDGPVIQEAGQVALEAGTTLPLVLELVGQARRDGIRTPIALMGYFNPFLRYGLPRLVVDAGAAGVDGLIIPDLPAHSAAALARHAVDAGLSTVFFASPGSRPERVRQTASMSTGFLYCLAADGATGEREELDHRLEDYLALVRSVSDIPLAVGFGISTPEHVRALRDHADGVIVGSALLRRIAEAPDAAGRRSALRKLVTELKAATR